MEALEEGECSEEGSSRANEEEEGKVEETGELEPAVEENKEENGVVLSVIQQELQSKQLHSPASHQDNCLLEDVSWPCSDGGQSEKQVRPIAGCGEEGEETQDKVSPETLEALGHCEVIRSMLANPYLRDLLLELDGSPAPQLALRRAMNIPVFVEFADQCLRVCGLRDDEL